MAAIAKYGAVLRIMAITSLAYRTDALIRCLWMGFILFVFVQLWSVTYARGGLTTVAGFTLADMVWYLVITETVVLSAPRVSNTIDEEVKSGELAYVLLRPYSYALYHLASYWGLAAVLAPVNFAIGASVALLAVGPPPNLSLGAVVATAVAIVLGLTLNFLVEFAIGLLAFWFEDTLPFFWIYQKLVFTVGGLFLPLELLPGPLAAVARLLPFAAVTYAPARIFTGFSPSIVAGHMALQLVWGAILAMGVAAVYAQAVKKVNIHGG